MNLHDQRPRVTVFSMGGTIASTHDGQRTGVAAGAAAGVSPELGAQALVDAVPALAAVAEIEAIEFRKVASSELTIADVTALADEITRCLDAGADGVVITQGTDTIEETSFGLDLLVSSSKPVVVTGAMRNPSSVGPDGAANLLAAVQVAAAPAARDLGTLVVANDEVHAARFVRKSHTTSPGTFQSPTVGPLGWVSEGQARIAFRLSRLAVLSVSPVAQIPAVALLTSVLGDDSRLITQVEKLGYAGLVLKAFGGGHVPSDVVPSLQQLAARLPVVLASRTSGGETLTRTYGFPGSEMDLLGHGLISAGILSGPKSRILLSLLLASGAEISEIRSAFVDVNEVIGG